jgi:hypothetical protein
MLTRISAKAAAVTASIVIGAGVAAAAATGSLPGQTSTSSDVQAPVSPTTSTTSSTVKTATNTPTTEDQKGPDVSSTSEDLHGLCTAWQHNSDEAKQHSQAMAALEKAAGGQSNVAAFCQTNAPATVSPTSTTEVDHKDANEHDTEAPENDHATTSTTEVQHEDQATTSTTEVQHEDSHGDSGVSGS